jgi:transcriptional regulator with XRE-family HTH domain
MEQKRTLQQIMEEERINRIELFKSFFSDKLKELRQEKQLSQKTVAHNLGIAVSTYANWEQGRTEPSIYDIFNLLWVFEIEPNELFDINDFKQ